MAEHLLSASFRESIDALKEAGLTDTEILEIMSESVDGQTITKKSSSIKESGQELPSKNNDITNETPSVRKRKTAALGTEKQRKTVRQGSPGHSIEREDAHFDYSFDRVSLSSLSIGQNTFSFSADMDEASDLAERALNGEFPELSKRSPAKTPKNPNKPADSIKINKKPLFLKKFNFIKNEKQLRDLFHEINPSIKFSKSTFYSSGNIKLLAKTTTDYQLINDYAFSSAIYRLTNKHITIEESTNNLHNSTLCINNVNIATTLEEIEQAFIYRDIPIKNLKRCTKANGSFMTLITFNLVSSSDRPELLR